MKRGGITYQEDEPQNPFALSIGDLMAALLLIFVLLLSATLLNLQERAEMAENYKDVKKEIYDELIKEFKDDLKDWNANIDEKDLLIRFSGPRVEFDFGNSEVKPQFKEILSDFFPRYVRIITLTKFKDNIEEIRIEGHTDNKGTYFNNMELSQNRTRSVLNFVLENTNYEPSEKSWIQLNLTANGLSYSKPIADNDTEQGQKKNRRVEFRIRTNAEKQIDEMLKVNLNE
jgi:outer membrane protein OmpA-like peptidoglycan-associated protein